MLPTAALPRGEEQRVGVRPRVAPALPCRGEGERSGGDEEACGSPVRGEAGAVPPCEPLRGEEGWKRVASAFLFYYFNLGEERQKRFYNEKGIRRFVN